MNSYLTEMKVDGFRGLRALSLAHLTQIAAVVGKPCAGKTCLLEAIAERSCFSAMRVNRASVDSPFAILDEEAKGGCLAALRLFQKTTTAGCSGRSAFSIGLIPINTNGTVRIATSISIQSRYLQTTRSLAN